jgi:type II secretory pathway component PulJ
MKLFHIKKRKGFTLISLLVGLAISLIIIVALMNLYKAVVQASNSSITRANVNGSLNNSILVGQNMLQQAGYGIVYSSTTTITSNLIVLKNATFNGSTLSGQAATVPSSQGASSVSGNAVIWGWVEPTTSTYYCQGLLFYNNALYQLNGTSCSSASNWASTVWSYNILVTTGLASTSNFVAAYNTCSNYGSNYVASTPIITINPVYSDGEVNNTSSSVCLSNL